jgi:hypothetical protein
MWTEIADQKFDQGMKYGVLDVEAMDSDVPFVNGYSQDFGTYAIREWTDGNEDMIGGITTFGGAYLTAFPATGFTAREVYEVLEGEKRKADNAPGDFTKHYATFDGEDPQGFDRADLLTDRLIMTNLSKANKLIRGYEDTNEGPSGWSIGLLALEDNQGAMDGQVDSQYLTQLLNSKEFPDDAVGIQVVYGRNGEVQEIIADSYNENTKQRAKFEKGTLEPVDTEKTDYSSAARSLTDIMAQYLQ